MRRNCLELADVKLSEPQRIPLTLAVPASLPGLPHPAEGPEPHYSPQGHWPLFQSGCSKAGLQLPAALPCPARPTPDLNPNTASAWSCPCPQGDSQCPGLGLPQCPGCLLLAGGTGPGCQAWLLGNHQPTQSHDKCECERPEFRCLVWDHLLHPYFCGEQFSGK